MSAEDSLVVRARMSDPAAAILSSLENNLNFPINLFDIEANQTENEPEDEPSVLLLAASLDESPFSKFGGQMDMLLLHHILVYLSAKDLVILSGTCKYFRKMNKNSFLWETLNKIDFVDVVTDQESSLSIRDIDVRNSTQSIYMHRYIECKDRLTRSKDDKRQLAIDVRRLDRIRCIEFGLDLIHVRLLPPMVFSSVFISLILYCRKVDGLNIPYWACAAPIFSTLLLVSLSSCSVYYLKNKQFETKSLFEGMYSNLRGPIPYFLSDILHGSRSGFIWFNIAMISLSIQLALVVVKLSPNIPTSFLTRLSWGMVFIPIWLVFFCFCCSPLTRFRMEISFFIPALIFIWIPMFILFVCVAVKLDHVQNIRMAYIFIPFFIIEGAIMIGSLGIFLVDLYR
jgi:hypothetical protein